MSEEPSEFKYGQKGLDEDEYAETDPITVWPEGFSIMYASDTADWNGYGREAVVETHRTGSIGWQSLTVPYFGDTYRWRAYDVAGMGPGGWGSWMAPTGGWIVS